MSALHIEREVTTEERKWLKSAHRLMAKMPATLTLFGCESGLMVLHASEGGMQRMTPHKGGAFNAGGCVDQDYIVAKLTDRCDGGAW